jgi:hypothetical protein
MELKELALSLRELSQSYEEFGKMLSGVVDTVKPLKRLIGDPEGKSNGSQFITAGIALIAFPVPIITDVPGATLIVAGLIQNRVRQTTAMDVYKELQQVTGKLENISKELLITK